MNDNDKKDNNLILRKYLKDVIAWHGFIRFLGLPTLQNNPDVSIDELYIAQSVSETYLSTDTSPQIESLIDPVDFLVEKKRIVVLGDPGSGKSTLINWFSWYLASGFSRKLPEPVGELIPVCIVLRDIDLSNVIDIDTLISSFLTRPVADAFRDHRQLLLELLKEGKVLLLIDGLDEISTEYKKTIKKIISKYSQEYPNNYVVCTSRIIGYESENNEEKYSPENLEETKSTSKANIVKKELSVCYVSPFTESQISQFSLKWYKDNLSGNEKNASLLRDDFIEAISKNPSTKQLARTPHLLTMMALIYKIKSQLPNGRALLYDLIAQAYLESIDTARKLQDKYLWQEKKRWLARVGFEMQLKRSRLGEESQKNLLIDKEEILSWIMLAMKDSGYRDVVNDNEYATEFLDWIARRSGLLIPRGENQFAFLHLSFQEYFSAVYIQQQLENPEWDRTDSLEDEEEESSLDNRFKENLFESWSNQVVWQQPIILLFELMGAKPGWPRKLWKKCFDDKYIENEKHLMKEVAQSEDESDMFWNYSLSPGVYLRVQLMANPHSGLSSKLFSKEFRRLLEFLLYFQQEILPFAPNHGFLMSDSIFLLSSLLKIPEGREEWLGENFDFGEVKYLTLSNLNQKIFDDVLNKLHFRNKLVRLDIFDGSITNIEAISNFHRLELLNIEDLNISNIKPLSQLKNLRRLTLESIGSNFDLNFAPLQGLKNLDHLIISEPSQEDKNTLIDLSFLSKLPNLETLFLPDMIYSNFNSISCLKKLTSLFLRADPGISFNELEPLPLLDNLFLCYFKNSLDGLSKMKNIESLNIYKSEFEDLTPIGNLSKLRSLEIIDTPVKDVSPLAKLTGLADLKLRGTKVDDLSPLEHLDINLENVL